MLTKTLVKGLNKRRLRNLLMLFFLALAVPTTVLVWQAYGQLKWEAFHQHRGVAEELTQRIDARLNDMISMADARSFADYTFLVVSGDPSANFVQRSPLSAYPVAADLPGVLGYFQVDTDGIFSTPLLPSEAAQAANLGIGENEYANRVKLAAEMQQVLAENRLVQSQQDIAVRRRVATSPGDSVAALEESIEGGYATYRADAPLSEKIVEPSEDYSQEIFDQLNEPGRDSLLYADKFDDGFAEEADADQEQQRANRIGKVSDLKLDADLQKKSEEAERQGSLDQISSGGAAITSAEASARSKLHCRNLLPRSAANRL